MLTDLKFVAGSVAKKDYLPALTHFVIEKGTIRGFNGALALCTPIAFNMDCKPKASQLIQAVKNCSETIALSMTGAGRLSIKSGNFKAFIDCTELETNHVVPEGDVIAIDGKALMNAVRVLSDFVADDASRPWSNGILLKGQSAYATNNVVIVEYWTGVDLPTVNLPRAAVRELLRINEDPESAQANAHSFSLHFSGSRWLRTQVGPTDWPDLARILDVPADLLAVDPLIFDGLESIKPFTDKSGKVYFYNEQLRTHLDDNTGGAYEMGFAFPYDGCYNLEHLLSLKDVVKKIDFTLYPKPAQFTGDRLRGAIVGMRK